LFDGIGAVIPERRRDVEFGGDVTVTKNDLFLLGRFSPFVSVGLSRRESTIDIFSFTEGRFFFGVERAL
ncbi:MAG: hypothetical protein AAFV86_14415, partial [Pseudomonadota bacterium]